MFHDYGMKVAGFGCFFWLKPSHNDLSAVLIKTLIIFYR